MSRTHVPHRALLAGRRITGAADWSVVAAALLGLLAAVEVTLRAPDDSPGVSASDLSPDLTSALLLGLCATLPLAVARTHIVPAAITITTATFLTLVRDDHLPAGGVLAQLAVLYLLGVRHARRARRESSLRDASRRAAADNLLEYAARGERARIARELHDVVAHHISMIAVQAETARLATPGMPADGERKLLAIGDTARAALTEMRRLLGVLREDAGPEPTRRPQPGLDQLNELIDEARRATAASTRLIVRGTVGPLDPGIQLTAYRIVQEALTNARRHAPGAAVDVELAYTTDALRLRIRDNGPGPPPDDETSAGHGLVGMRERAAMVGGTLSTGPAPAGGFLVAAALPTSTAR